MSSKEQQVLPETEEGDKEPEDNNNEQETGALYLAYSISHRYLQINSPDFLREISRETKLLREGGGESVSVLRTAEQLRDRRECTSVLRVGNL